MGSTTVVKFKANVQTEIDTLRQEGKFGPTDRTDGDLVAFLVSFKPTSVKETKEYFGIIYSHLFSQDSGSKPTDVCSK
jgi:hypothetical protein